MPLDTSNVASSQLSGFNDRSDRSREFSFTFAVPLVRMDEQHHIMINHQSDQYELTEYTNPNVNTSPLTQSE